MDDRSETGTHASYVLPLIIYWLVVGVPLAWGIWTTVRKLPALFQ